MFDNLFTHELIEDHAEGDIGKLLDFLAVFEDLTAEEFRKRSALRQLVEMLEGFKSENRWWVWFEDQARRRVLAPSNSPHYKHDAAVTTAGKVVRGLVIHLHVDQSINHWGRAATPDLAARASSFAPRALDIGR